MLLICVLVASASSARAQNAANGNMLPDTIRTLRDGIGLRLMVAKPVVHSTEPVAIEVQVINRSTQSMYLYPSEPWAMTTLTIFKDGKLYPPAGPRRTDHHFPSIWAWPHLAPSESYVTRWHYGEYYYSIFYWGYGNGELPVGHYVITARPLKIGGQFSNREKFRADSTIAGTATLDVVP